MKSPLLLLLWALSLTTTAAYADTIKNFYYEGTFASTGTLSGTITIDTTTGVVTDASPFLIGNISYPNTVVPPEVLTFPGETVISFGWETNLAFLQVNLALPVTTLVGYTGSLLCIEARPCPSGDVSNISHELSVDFLTSGSISQVPEPSTLAMLAPGVVTLAGTVRRRFRP